MLLSSLSEHILERILSENTTFLINFYLLQAVCYCVHPSLAQEEVSLTESWEVAGGECWGSCKEECSQMFAVFGHRMRCLALSKLFEWRRTEISYHSSTLQNETHLEYLVGHNNKKAG